MINVKRIFMHPLIVQIAIHSGFWLLINISFAVYLYLFFRSLDGVLNVSSNLNFLPLLTVTLIMACCQGIVLGAATYFINKLFFIIKSLWRIVLLYIVTSLATFLLCFLIFKHLSTSMFLSRGIPFVQMPGTWDHLFNLALFHSLLGAVIAGFGGQIVKKYGKEVFVPMLFGLYRVPREEKRIFMFLDLKSSTELAEHLGHMRYSAFVQDFMLDLNHCLPDYNADVYQYVGDEAVLTWRWSQKNLRNSLSFFFACEAHILKRRSFYTKKYGCLPLFKAGVHCGTVTAVEIGDIKRDIAYHGDIINTAARIQAMCNETGNKLLISKSTVDGLGSQNDFAITSLGNFHLKGKENDVELFAVYGNKTNQYAN